MYLSVGKRELALVYRVTIQLVDYILSTDLDAALPTLNRHLQM